MQNQPEIIGIINEVYEDGTAGPYYLNILRRIPTTFEEGWNSLGQE